MKYNPETGKIVNKEGKVVATFNAETKLVTLLVPLAPVLKGQISSALKEAGHSVEGFENAGDQGQQNPPAPPPNPEASKASPPVTLPPPVAHKSKPPIPEQDPLAGDKTPAVIAWYKEHDPAEYKRRYEGRKIPTV